MPRRHDIDALRVAAFAILILYHVSGVYQVDSDFHIASSYRHEWLDYVRIVFNRWRMPLLFAISGIAIGLSLPGRGLPGFALRRSLRLLLPLAFGMLFIVSVQAYCEGVAKGTLEPGFLRFLGRYLQVRPWPEAGFSGAEYGITWNHLWYLAYLWVYSMALLALTPLLDSRPGTRLAAWLARPRHGALMLLPAGLFFGYLVVLAPRFPPTHALVGDWYLHAEYFSVFLFGYAMARQDAFWTRLQDLRWPMLAVAVAAICVELLLKAAGQYLPAGDIPPALAHLPWGRIERGARAVYMWSTLLAIFAWGHTLLNRPMRCLPYASEAVYPWYILHQSLIVLVAYWLIPLRLGAWLEPALVTLATIGGCLLLHEFVIRRVSLLRPLFGLKPELSCGRTATPVAATIR
ncbi:acyltransferase family protein [Luteimonas sp. MC1572]|uniref:acyltransferase family protein n=1 Tax=Luteimonas sp. MC1572 TaxID=2799325 RepID=UPI0018F0F7DF|nr:acyltransferase family protein [Luteimonas sp. MC1572]MBJ6980620.1 acyltransferase family protein [Luteimonas sp. MC1572]QQO01999.1 acyltransferase family protein [Luteimonas sp. MC1572]